jgi:DNA repair protein SbcD/Mre11
VKLVHAADLHLDSPLRGLERYPGAPAERMRGATRAALQNLVDLCIRERAGLLVLAGDLYDGDWPDYATGMFFATQMLRLAEANIEVAWIRGNHDAVSVITRHLRLPSHVRELPYGHAATEAYPDLGVAVHGQGFVQREVVDDLAKGYPERIPSLLNVGLLHTALEGRELHGRYAPTTLDVLRSKGYDYWALGHVHTREVVCRPRDR